LKAISLFAGGGVGETYLKDINIHTVVANELLPERAAIYKHRFPDTEMVVGDIKENKSKLIEIAKKENVKLLIATPPCQGMSNLGQRNYDTDIRNYLIFDVLDIVDNLDLDYIFIENVPKFLNMCYPYKSKILNILDIFNEKYGEKYNIEYGVYNAADYGVPQIRKRALIRIYKKDLVWKEPAKQPHITLKEAIGHLPSVESGEDSGIPFHYGPKHSIKHIETLKHTPTGCSAYDNPVYYPKRDDGERVRGYHNTYTRLSWDKVCPTRTMNSGTISGSNNCHPGRLLDDGTYSDARVLTLLELFIVSSLPENMSFPENTKEKQIREIVGEGIPPLMSKAFLSQISD
jgi:DNA (cytosine-5)-methyltransferase 1